ncbi:3TM-type holin [Oricola sp.]|uniref:3TM-type holin n=1 Tax=Oricola sp. TaxID=1979950 RepID=UPI003BAA9A7D
MIETLAATIVPALLKRFGASVLEKVARTGRVGEVVAEIAKHAEIPANAGALQDLADSDPAAFAQAVAAAEQTASARWAAILSEAKNPSIFVAGARPAAIWVCVVILFYAGLFAPVGNSLLQLVGYAFALHDLPALVQPPTIAWETLLWLLPLLYGIRGGEGILGAKRDSL